MANGRDTVPIQTPEYLRLRALAAQKKKQAQQIPGPFGGVAERRYQMIPPKYLERMSPRQREEARKRLEENERRRAEILAQQGGVYPPQQQPGFIPRMIQKTIPPAIERFHRYAGRPLGAIGTALTAPYGTAVVGTGAPAMGVTTPSIPVLPDQKVLEKILEDYGGEIPLPKTAEAFRSAIAAIQTEKGLDWDAAVSAFTDAHDVPEGYVGAMEGLLSLFIPPGAFGPLAGITRGTVKAGVGGLTKIAPPTARVLGAGLKAPAYMAMGTGGVGGPRMPRFGPGREVISPPTPRGDDDAIRALKGMVKPEGVNQRMYDELVEYAPTLSDAQLDETISASEKMIRGLKRQPGAATDPRKAIAIHELGIRIAKAEKARRVAAPTAAIPTPGAMAVDEMIQDGNKLAKWMQRTGRQRGLLSGKAFNIEELNMVRRGVRAEKTGKGVGIKDRKSVFDAPIGIPLTPDEARILGADYHVFREWASKAGLRNTDPQYVSDALWLAEAKRIGLNAEELIRKYPDSFPTRKATPPVTPVARAGMQAPTHAQLQDAISAMPENELNEVIALVADDVFEIIGSGSGKAQRWGVYYKAKYGDEGVPRGLRFLGSTTARFGGDKTKAAAESFAREFGVRKKLKEAVSERNPKIFDALIRTGRFDVPTPTVTPVARAIVPDDPNRYGIRPNDPEYPPLRQPNGAPVRGTPISPDDARIPDEVYHVTTNAPAVRSTGLLRASGEGGLGGDELDAIVSFTTDRGIANQLADDFRLASEIANMPEDSLAIGERLLRQATEEGWGESPGFSRLVALAREGKHKRIAKDWLVDYFGQRAAATQKRNPILLGDAEKFRGWNPANIEVIPVPKTSLRTGAMVTDFDDAFGIDEFGIGLKEIRVYGDVPVTPTKAIPTPTARAAAPVDTMVNDIANRLGHQVKRNPLNNREWVFTDEAGELTIKAELAPSLGDPNRIRLVSMASPSKGLGNASRWMDELVSVADENNIALELSAVPFGRASGGLTKRQLKAFYTKRGFKFEQGSDSGVRGARGQTLDPSVTTTGRFRLTFGDEAIAAEQGIPTPGAAIAKEPWQMTKAEFNAARVTKQQMLDRGAEGNLNSAVEIQMPISRIEGLEPIPAMEGGYVPGRLITQPVEIRYEKDLDQFILYAGNHRVQQARINGQSTVPAFVEGIKYEDLKQAIPTPTAAKTVKKIPAKKQAKSSDAPSSVKEELPERFVKPNNPVVTETPPPKAAQGPPEPMDDGNFNRNNFGGDGPPPKTTAEPPTGPDDIVLDLTDTKELEELIFTDDYFRKIIQLPGMRQTLGHSNPAGAARTPMEKFAALRTWLMNESTERTIRAMGHIDRHAEDTLFGPFTKERLIKKGPLKGLGLNDIRTYPKRYAKKLTPEQTEWIKQMDEIERSKLASLERNEVEVNLLGFEEGGQYAGRRWMGKFDNDGKLIDIGYVGGGSRRKLPTFLEPRVLKSQSEGFKLGFQAMSETEALALNVQGHYTHIIDKKMYDWLIYHSGIGYRDVGISEGMKLADAAVKMKAAAGKKAILALQRAMRGETIPTGTVKSIERVFPQLKGKVRAPTKVLAQDVIKAAKELQKPNVVLEVPKIGAIKKVQKLLEEASERLSQNPADKALRREVSRLQKSLGFIRYRVGLGKPLELIRVPAKELRKMAVDSLQEMLDAIRGTPTKVEGYKTLQYRGGLLSDLLVEQKKTSKSIADYKKKWGEPGREEAYLQIPGGERRILTGPDAKTIAIRMNNIFTPAENKFYNILAFANKFNVLFRGLQLTADGGVGLIHLAILAGAEPKIWTKAMWAFHNELIRSAASKSVTNRIYKQHAALLNRWPIVQLSEQGTEATAAFARGQLLKARLPAGIPLIGGRQVLALPDKLLQPFRNAFNFAMDQAAIDLIKALEHLATTPRLKAEISRYINNVRGLGSSKQIGVGKWMRLAEQSVMLAPNYNRSIVAIFSSLFRGGMDAKLARQALMRATFAFMFVTVAIGLARGDTLRESLDRFKLMRKDPKTGELKYNSEFMLFDQWGQRIGAGSKIRSVLALLATVTTSPEDLLESGMRNPAFRFMRANLAPLPSKATDLISGRNYIGDPTRDGMVSLSREVIAPTFLPLWASSLALEGGDLKGRFSRGTADYFALRAYPQDAHHKFVAYAEEQTGKSYDGPSEGWLSAPPYYWSWGKMEWIKEEKEKITPLELKKLKTIDPEGSRLWEAAELDWARRDKISPVMREFDRVADIRMDKLQDAADEARRTGNTPGLREAIVKINSAYGAQLQAVQSNPEFEKALDELSKIHKNEIPEQEAKRLYNEIVNDPALLNELQEYDFDERNRRLDLLEKEVGEEIWNGILAEKQLDRQRFDPLVQLWYEDKEKLKSYWALPEGERRRNERRRNKGAIDVIMIRWYGLKPGLSKAGFDEYRRIQSGKAPEASGAATTLLDLVRQQQGQPMPAPTPEPTPGTTLLDLVRQQQQEREPVGARE